MFYVVWVLGVFLAVMLSAVVTLAKDNAGKLDD